MTEYQNFQSSSSMNSGYLSQSALEIRLETREILEKIQAFLSGQNYLTVQDVNTGKITLQKHKVGRRLMSDEGVAHLVNYVSSIINPAVVQGNYTDDWYRQHIVATHQNLAYIITVNTPYWEIIPTARHSIIGFIMELVKPFLSRLIDNKERESYSQTIKSIESSQISSKPSAIQNIGIK